MSRSDEELERVGGLIRSTMAEVTAPPSLRADVEAQRAAARRPRRQAAAPAFGRRPLFAASGLGAAAVAAALALVLVGGTAGPNIDQAAAAALAPPTAPPPAVDPHDPTALRASVGSVRFPSWAYGAAWHPTGTRHAMLARRRPATVVYYTSPRAGDRVGYAIVSGPALAKPAGRTVVRGGVGYTLLNRSGADVVVWEQGGHTCVLAGHGVSSAQLLRLAGSEAS